MSTYQTILVLLFSVALSSSWSEDAPFIPRRHSKPPGPALTPEQAQAAFRVPPGFTVELVAAEPDLVNPVAMAFDEQGRIWVTESFEYPRLSAGKGRDRVKMLEDTDHDGKVDKVTVFADDLNIPSGIAVGHGGVWVANAPDILFMQDTDGDGRADTREVVVTGFGRKDTHELPNSLSWGPDGWLYGLNGVFNPAVIKQGDKEFRFTCAMFRIHPRTREFQVFAEGTSNPWGIAFDPAGSAFVSACVIDHLWHLTETGYYHRQGGPYPRFTWKLGAINDHSHQKAAYCGLSYFDSAAYPEQYRGRLFMGNLHGSCINTDVLERRGATYVSRGEPDFMSTDDVWFMPVSQKTGPDGCLYVLDWYDRYHCYQDARRDAAGLDRSRGRLWRVRYGNSPRAPAFDLSKASGAELIARLGDDNVYFRETAQRLLAERQDPRDQAALAKLVLAAETSDKQRMHGLFARIGSGALDDSLQAALLTHEKPLLRAWGVRAAGNFGRSDAKTVAALRRLATDGARDVQLQVAIAAPKIAGDEASSILGAVVAASGDDPLIPPIVWQNLYPLLDRQSATFIEAIAAADPKAAPGLQALLPRVVEHVLAARNPDLQALAALFGTLLETDRAVAGRCLSMLAKRVQSGELEGDALVQLRASLAPRMGVLLAAAEADSLTVQAALLAASWRDPAALALVRRLVAAEGDAELRLQGVEALVSAGDPGLLDTVTPLLADRGTGKAMRQGILAALGKVDEARAAEVALGAFPALPGDLQTAVIELCVQRPVWSRSLMAAIAAGSLPATAVNLNQIRVLQQSDDAEVASRARSLWGALRAGRNPERERVIAEVRGDLLAYPGDPFAGAEVFKNACGVCHQIYGEGAAIGPDVTGNGRGSFGQLLSNVLDPSLVIGEAFLGRTVKTRDGRVLFGVVSEENEQRLVLRMIGGHEEIIPRRNVAGIEVSETSLMPEGLEKTMSRQQLRDLFAFLVLDKPPGDPAARSIPGANQLDAARLYLPKTAVNHLLGAKLRSNTDSFGDGRRGATHHPVFDPVKERFHDDSRWHEDGVPMNKDLGVVAENKAVWWEAIWAKPVAVNLMALSGCYPNQPQAETGWKIELRGPDGKWRVHDQGVGGWYDNGRYVWGSAATKPTAVSGFRVSIFSKDDKTPLRSPHFRGEPHVSWFVGLAEPGTILER